MAWQALAGAGLSAASSLFGKKKGGPPKWLRKLNKRTGLRAEELSQRPYTAFTGERVAPLTGNEQQASALAGNFGARTEPFRSRLSQGFSTGALSQYENPYLDRVLENQRRVIGEEYGRQSSNLQRRQSATDAFRTGQSALNRSRLDESRMRALGDAEATGRAGAFDKAMESYFKDRGIDLGALSATTGATQAEIGALSQTGATERSVYQAERNFDYGQFIEGRDWDVNNFNVVLDAIRAISGGAGQSSPNNTAAGLAGLAGTIFSNWKA